MEKNDETGNRLTNCSILHQNLQSIGNCLDRIKIALSENEDCLCLCVTEHWKSAEQLPAYQIPGYVNISSFCRKEGAHGGSAIYCRSNVACRERRDICDASESLVFECSAVEFFVNEVKNVVVCVYRIPDDGFLSNFFERLTGILDILSDENCNLFIAGDFNIDVMSSSSISARFLTLLKSYDLHPSV